jgi:hypothetical protein
MNINRHNYEELFLLYVDNELSAADKKAVDVFVHENPDLGIELDLLKQTVLPADEILLEKKDWLYMEEKISSLQEDLLLYADDELPTADKEFVEGLLKTDKAAQAEWQILRQTKLQPDTSVVFEDKASLYRKEPARVVTIRWWRVAAAAVVLGFGVWGGLSVYNNSAIPGTDQTELAVKDRKGAEGTKEPGVISNTTIIAEDQQSAQSTSDALTAANVNVQNRNADEIKNRNAGRNPAINPGLEEQQKNITAQTTIKQDNDLPRSYLEKINNSSSNQNTVAIVQPESYNISRVSGNNSSVIENNTINAGTSNSRNDHPVAAIQVANTGNPSANNSYLDTDDKQKRTALSGLIRKAKRVVERTTNINTGEGIKIAGFEIALK